MWTFIAGMVVGSIIGILMVALVSANRDDKED
jgi:hypothetical protein